MPTAEFTEDGQAINWEPEVENTKEVIAEVPPPPTAEEVQEVQEEAAEAATPVTQDADDQTKEYKNVYARARILERDNAILSERLNIILQNMQQVPQQQQQAAMQRAEEGEPDPELDPIGAMMYQIKSINARLDRSQYEQMQAAARGSRQQQLAYADSMIRQTAVQNPDMFNAAILHLAQIVQDQIEDEHPEMTERERLGLVQSAIEDQKLKWISSGKNPGEEYLKRAKRFGFKWEDKAPQAAPAKKADAREQIRQEKERDQRGRTIGTVKGAPAKAPMSSSAIRKMNDDQFNRWIDSSLKDGSLTVEPGRYGKTPSFSQLLPGKGRPTR